MRLSLYVCHPPTYNGGDLPETVTAPLRAGPPPSLPIPFVIKYGDAYLGIGAEDRGRASLRVGDGGIRRERCSKVVRSAIDASTYDVSHRGTAIFLWWFLRVLADDFVYLYLHLLETLG